MQALACSAAPQNNLGFVAEIPLEKLGEVAGTKVEVVNLIFNGADDIVDLRRTESDFTMFKRDKAFHFSLLSVPPGNYKCRVVLRNMETGRAAVAGATAVVPERKPEEILLYPPLFLAPEKGAFYIEESSAKGSSNKGGPALFAKAFLFDPAQYAPFLETTLKGGTETWVSVRCAVPKGLTGDIRLAASFLDAQTGEEIPVPLTVVARNDGDGVRGYFVRLEIPAVEPDTYRFSLLAEGPNRMSSRLVRDIVIK
jgi:hypothetical protein